MTWGRTLFCCISFSKFNKLPASGAENNCREKEVAKNQYNTFTSWYLGRMTLNRKIKSNYSNLTRTLMNKNRIMPVKVIFVKPYVYKNLVNNVSVLQRVVVK